MALSYSFEQRILVVHMVGEYTTEDLRTTVLTALANPQRSEDSTLLFDLRESRAVRSRTPDELRQMARFLAGLAERYNRRIAMVVSEDLVFGMMRMGSAIAEHGGVEANVFRDLDEARGWLLAA